MYFARGTAQKLKIAVIALAVYLLAAALLASFLPAEEASFQEAFLQWFIGIPATLVAWLCVEWFGTKALGGSFWSRMPSWTRVTLLVLAITLAAVCLIVVQVWWHSKSAA